MKKIFFAICILFASFSSANAQYVTIPDTNFANYLIANYPTAMVGNQMDTTHVDIVSTKWVDVSLKNISDLSGIIYFDSLIGIYASGNNFSNIPLLPQSTKEITINNNQSFILNTSNLPNCDYLCLISNNISINYLPNSISNLVIINCNLSTLPILPTSLQILNCSENALTNISNLPASLISLNCNANNLSSSSIILPNSLLDLYCTSNSLSALFVLPDSLRSLDCSNNNLSVLPNLPTKLSFLNCSNNQITSLPVLPQYLYRLIFNDNLVSALFSVPNYLVDLNCSNNLISILPSLPNSMTTLSCANLGLFSLPSLPIFLNYLNARNNNLTTLPNFSSGLLEIDLKNNPNLTCLQKLPQFIQYLNIDSTSITCLPNTFSIMPNMPWASSSILSSLPLCTASSGCPFYYNITGNAHQDTSTNCALDSTNPGTHLTNLKVQMLKNNLVQEQMYITTNGEYSFDATTGDTVNILIDTVGLPFSISCPNTFAHQEILTLTDSIHYNVNFGIKQLGVDASVNSIYGRFRNATISLVNIEAGDATKFYGFNGTSFSGTVTTTFSGPVQYISAANGALIPNSVLGNVITYSIANFSILPPNAFDILLKTDTNAIIGAAVCITTKITNVAGNINASNDSLTNCFTVVNSYDPNEKTVFPKNAKAGDWLTYNIQFQNTGNDTAFLVVVKDTLSSNLDVASFTLLGASHESITQIKNNIATFTFANINLIDSLHNEPASHGWIQFKIKLKNTLPSNAVTNNQAAIYFDYNAPIYTNIATNTIAAPLGIYQVNNTQFNLQIYPNPASNQFTLVHNVTGKVTAKIFSIDGRVIKNIVVDNATQIINTNALQTGVYTLVVSNEDGLKIMKKIVIEK
jgi:uncharacterized repeat protein (TIGR01451 family)